MTKSTIPTDPEKNVLLFKTLKSFYKIGGYNKTEMNLGEKTDGHFQCCFHCLLFSGLGVFPDHEKI